MEAGSDTTSSTVLSYLLGVIGNPTALAKAQEELDSICGTERSPNMDDLDKLPYLRACMNEVRETVEIHMFFIDAWVDNRHYDGGLLLLVASPICSCKTIIMKATICPKER